MLVASTMVGLRVTCGGLYVNLLLTWLLRRLHNPIQKYHLDVTSSRTSNSPTNPANREPPPTPRRSQISRYNPPTALLSAVSSICTTSPERSLWLALLGAVWSTYLREV